MSACSLFTDCACYQNVVEMDRQLTGIIFDRNADMGNKLMSEYPIGAEI